MRKLIAVMAILICVTMLGGCFHGGYLFSRNVRTSGTTETKNYDIEDFTGLTLKGMMKEVNIELRNGDYSVEIEADSNYFNELEVDKRGDNLRISLDERRKLNKPVNITISAPGFSSMDLQGAMKLRSSGTLEGRDMDLNIEGAVEADLDIEYSRLKLRVSGAAEADLYGEVDELDINCEGAAEINARRLTARDGKVYIAGAAEVEVYCTDYLDATIEGVGEVRYSGDPEVKKNVAGLGSIKRSD